QGGLGDDYAVAIARDRVGLDKDAGAVTGAGDLLDHRGVCGQEGDGGGQDGIASGGVVQMGDKDPGLIRMAGGGGGSELDSRQQIDGVVDHAVASGGCQVEDFVIAGLMLPVVSEP